MESESRWRGNGAEGVERNGKAWKADREELGKMKWKWVETSRKELKADRKGMGGKKQIGQK